MERAGGWGLRAGLGGWAYSLRVGALRLGQEWDSSSPIGGWPYSLRVDQVPHVRLGQYLNICSLLVGPSCQ
jgi:hypothetical protein